MQSCVPGKLPTSRVTARNLDESPNWSAADRDGRPGKGLRDDSSGHRKQERLECSACRCEVMSATVVAEVVLQVVQQCTCGDVSHAGPGRAQFSGSSRDRQQTHAPRILDTSAPVLDTHAPTPGSLRLISRTYGRHRGQHLHGQHPAGKLPTPTANPNQSAAHRCIADTERWPLKGLPVDSPWLGCPTSCPFVIASPGAGVGTTRKRVALPPKKPRGWRRSSRLKRRGIDRTADVDATDACDTTGAACPVGHPSTTATVS